ncbi:podoplanin-like isoform X2 [Rhineura floridana]|uniref:podoplanin-like isoform X2 n=1 Tax=Rhineura floridana TaxID=261503 RepID=UPI002AC84910|nr:podoplanin-like isoform X2 [Rhineura floridana]
MFIIMQILVFLLGNVAFQVFAEEASTVLLEDETATVDSRDSDVSEFTELPSLLPLMTTDSVLSTSDNGENSTDPGFTEPSDDGLETAALVGIIIGIIVAIGVTTGIIIMVVKKMGRS